MMPIESLKEAQSILRKILYPEKSLDSKSFRAHMLSASRKLEDALKEIEAGVDVLGRDRDANEDVRLNCAFLDETCVDCKEDCLAAGGVG